MKNDVKEVKVPKGKVLLTSSADWFSDEVFYTAHNAGARVDQEALRAGQLLADGESVVVKEKIRNDMPEEARDWTVTESRISNVRGRAKTVELSRRNVG